MAVTAVSVPALGQLSPEDLAELRKPVSAIKCGRRVIAGRGGAGVSDFKDGYIPCKPGMLDILAVVQAEPSPGSIIIKRRGNKRLSYPPMADGRTRSSNRWWG